MSIHDEIPASIAASAIEVGEWMDNHGYQAWRLGPCADRKAADAMEKRIVELERSLAAAQATNQRMRDLLTKIEYLESDNGCIMSLNECSGTATEALALPNDRSALDAMLAEAEKRSGLNVKLWLWKNFVNGQPEYLAFDNPFPVRMDCGDPQTLGEPCGYAIFKESRNGRPDVAEAEVLRMIRQAAGGE